LVDRHWKYVRDKDDLNDELKAMFGYADKKLEIEKFFTNKITPYIQNQKLRIFEPCCGIGYLASHLSEISPESTFYCIDQTKEFIDIANQRYKSDRVKFECEDVYNIENGKPYDISYNFASLMIIPYYDEMLKKMFEFTGSTIFIFSLFYDGNIDFQVRIREWNTSAGKKDWNSFLNVYSKPQFENYAYKLGATNVEWDDFNIPFEIEKKDMHRMGAYTYKLCDGSIIEMSGVIQKHWKLVRIDL